MKRYGALLPLCALLCLGTLVVSCGSTAQVGQTDSTARAKADQAREQAKRIQADAVVPDLWQAAQDIYDQARYEEAERAFIAAYNAAKERKDADEERIRQAQNTAPQPPVTPEELRQNARRRMDLAAQEDLCSRAPDVYIEAAQAFNRAEQNHNGREYAKADPEYRKVLDLLADFETRFPRTGTPAQRAAAYVVKFHSSRTDCLWRIAGFDFIYGNSWEWRRIYLANRDTMPDPNNPDLVVPGQVLQIPPLRGEARSGTR
jgi:nucleoid-associated protein YgaU